MPASTAAATDVPLDLVVVADPRQRFAEGRCLAALLAAAAGRGYATALLPVLAPAATPGRPFHPAVASLIGRGVVALLDPDSAREARLALVYHLPPLLQPAWRRVRLRSREALVRVDQPWRALDGTVLLDPAAAVANAAELLGVVDRPPRLVAADPLLRAALAAEGLAHDDEIWPPVTGLRSPAGPGAAGASPPRLGRHLAGGEAAWLTIPDGTAGLTLAEEAARLAPPAHPAAGWSLSPGELADPGAFLHGLDAYVLEVGPGWRAGLLPALAEAVASGVPLVLPPSLRPLLGEAALYAGPGELAARLRELGDERSRVGRHEAASAFHAATTSPEALAARLERRLGPPTPDRHRAGLRLASTGRSPRRALFLSPNGIGMGHVTRLLAVARRCGAALEPVFLSMSQAVGVVERMGFLAEYFPYHAYTGEPAEAWNAALKARLDEAIAFYDPRVVVFDGNVPYQGLIDARASHPNRPFVWIRRPLWRPEHGRATIERARHFDLVVEPGELAAALDQGSTAGRGEEAARVPPVTLLEPGEVLPRAEAREALGLDPGRTAVLVQLGSRNNFDYAAIDQAILDELGRRPEVELVFVDWLIGERRQDLPAHVRRLSTFPVPRYLAAFDLAVSAAGYNSFHELLSLAVPTVLVPNENPMMDAQELRALWAERQGLALCVRPHDPYRMAWALRTLLDPARRALLRERCRSLPPCDGAAATARHLGHLAAAVRVPASPGVPPYTIPRGGG